MLHAHIRVHDAQLAQSSQMCGKEREAACEYGSVHEVGSYSEGASIRKACSHKVTGGAALGELPLHA